MRVGTWADAGRYPWAHGRETHGPTASGGALDTARHDRDLGAGGTLAPDEADEVERRGHKARTRAEARAQQHSGQLDQQSGGRSISGQRGGRLRKPTQGLGACGRLKQPSGGWRGVSDRTAGNRAAVGAQSAVRSSCKGELPFGSPAHATAGHGGVAGTPGGRPARAQC